MCSNAGKLERFQARDKGFIMSEIFNLNTFKI